MKHQALKWMIFLSPLPGAPNNTGSWACIGIQPPNEMYTEPYLYSTCRFDIGGLLGNWLLTIFHSKLSLDRICFAVIVYSWMKSQRNLAHATTAQLSWHVQSFEVKILLQFFWEQNEIAIKFAIWWKNCWWNKSQVDLPSSLRYKCG